MADSYAIIRTQGKQFAVTQGKTLTVDRMTAEVGESITFGEVLMISNNGAVKVGAPLLEGVQVKGKVLAHTRGKKVMTFKKRIKKGYTKRQGHRQDLTQVVIESIAG